MAKGRKLTTSRSERLLGSYNNGYSNGSHETVNDSSDLGEDDVWSTVDNMVNGDQFVNGSQGEWSPRAAAEGNGSMNSFVRHRPVPRCQVGGLSLAFDDPGNNTGSSRILHQFRGQDGVAAASPRARHVAMSAPLNVPDWSKIYRVDSIESLHDSDDGPDDREWEMVPPHEYVARCRNSAANSVFEGVGRTLKGRDLSRVRDAVWSQTGFDG